MYICSQKRPHDSISLYGICQSALGVCEVESLYEEKSEMHQIKWNAKKGTKTHIQKMTKRHSEPLIFVGDNVAAEYANYN